MRDHDVDGAGNLETLKQIAKAIDRAEECAAAIAKDGAVIQAKTGPRDHPLLRHELAARALACRLLQRIGAVTAPKNRVGRPGYGIGVTYARLVREADDEDEAH